MATFYDNFSGNLSNWIISSAAPVNRAWSIQSGLLKPADVTSDQYGLIRYKNPVDVNGRIIAEYSGLDLYNGTDNLVILRYTDNSHFVYVNVDPGQDDNRGVGVGFNSLVQSFNTNVVLYNSNGQLLSNEISPNKTIIPQSGKLDITYTGNKYDIVIRNVSNAFVASGSYIDTANNNLTSGYIGFGHSEKWDSNIIGWDSISATTFGATQYAPIINSFVATPPSINLGESTTLSWNISSGSDVTSAYIFAPISSAVPLSGSYTISPTTNTAYDLSAWSVAGSDTETTVVTVSDAFPIILSFTNSGPISATQMATLNWNISAATSAFIDNNIGWIDPYTSAGSTSTPPLLTTTTFNISAYDADLDIATASTVVTVEQLPIATFSIYGAPTCSGSTYNLVWNTQYATSAYLNNGIGQVALTGTLPITATVPTSYTLTAVNHIGQATAFSNAIVYYRAPIADAGDDVVAISTNGLPVSVTVDAIGSFDIEGLPLTYMWYNGVNQVSMDRVYTAPYPAGSTTTLDLVVMDACSFSATDSVTITVNSQIPPVARATATPSLLSEPGYVVLDGSTSYDDDGYIMLYAWYDNGALIGNGAVFNYYIDYGSHDIELRVTDDSALTSTTNVQVLVTTDALPTANAGTSQSICSNGSALVMLDGSLSVPPTVPTGSKLVYFEWDLSSLGIPNVASYITNVNEISATFVANGFGYYNIPLTVESDTGFRNTNSTELFLNRKPAVSTSDVSATIGNGQITVPVTLSAVAMAQSPIYTWATHINGITTYYTTGTSNITIDAPYGSNYAEVYVTDGGNSCVSNTARAEIDVMDTTLRIINFEVDPFFKIVNDGQPIYPTLSWEIYNATDAGIIGIGSVNPSFGSITTPNGISDTVTAAFILTATNGFDTVQSIIWGNYIFPFIDTGGGTIIPNPRPQQVCRLRNDYIVTYGLDELKYDRNRDIDIISYLPEYIQGSETQVILTTFQTYLNTMFKDQKNYVWVEDPIAVTECTSYDCSTYVTSCSSSAYSLTVTSGYGPTTGTVTLYGDMCVCSASTSAIDNTYILNTSEYMTPASKVDEIYIPSETCDLPNDTISILDKIYRLTDLLNPDLTPIDLIQNYTENLGFVAGFNRDSNPYASRVDHNAIGNTTNINIAEDELYHRRYLRFMARNLPEWYQIKTTNSSIAIMLYSFGLIGDFSLYYTKCYSDINTKGDLGLCKPNTNGLVDDSDGDGLEDLNITECYTSATIEERKCCIFNKYKSYITLHPNDNSDFVLNKSVENAPDWVLTPVNTQSLEEDLDPVVYFNNQYPGYFATPHFKLVIDLDKTSLKYSMDEHLQKSIFTAVNTVRPINTVFDGVGVSFKPDSVTVYFGSRARIRKNILIMSDGTYNGTTRVP
jgi:hypothetical protein